MSSGLFVWRETKSNKCVRVSKMISFYDAHTKLTESRFAAVVVRDFSKCCHDSNFTPLQDNNGFFVK